MGSAPSLLSMVRVTSARPSGGRLEVPAKMTSSILPPRRDLALCSPITQANASTTLDLPEPLGPTTQVMPGSKRSAVAEAKDLKPRRVRVFKCTGTPLPWNRLRKAYWPARMLACSAGGDGWASPGKKHKKSPGQGRIYRCVGVNSEGRLVETSLEFCGPTAQVRAGSRSCRRPKASSRDCEARASFWA